MEVQLHKVTGIYKGAEGRNSPFDFYTSDEGSDKIVLFAHGFKGFKDWGPWHLLAPFFVHRGFDWLAFNFSHNGGSVENPVDFPDTEAFGRNTYSKEVTDLCAILELVVSGVLPGVPNGKWREIYLIGHSRGGGIVVLAADQFKNKITAISTWAAVADFGERFPADVDAWRRSGTIYVQNARTGQQLPHHFTFWQDYDQNRDQLNILQAAARLSCPALVVHGTADESVSFNEAEKLHNAMTGSILFPVTGAGHTFGGKHPWPETRLPDDLALVACKTADFWEGL